VPARKAVVKTLAATLMMAIAIVAVGLTASPESSFTIIVTPIFLRLGIDVDVKLGSIHLHASWSALPSTKASASVF